MKIKIKDFNGIYTNNDENDNYKKPECVCDQKELVLKRKCARRGCSNEWSITIIDPNRIKGECWVCCPKFCGEYSYVCQPCEDQGYFASSGEGNGYTYIYKDDKEVDKFRS